MGVVSKLEARIFGAVVALLSASFTVPSIAGGQAGDHFALEFGNSPKAVRMARLIYQKTLYDQTESSCNCDSAYLEFGISEWNSRDSPVGVDNLYEIGVQPVYRLQRGPMSASFAVRPFLEVALGIHYLSKLEVPNSGYYTSTKFQFGEHLAWGMTFGKNDAFVLAQRFQHLSNANIRLPNPGINYQLIHLSYRY